MNAGVHGRITTITAIHFANNRQAGVQVYQASCNERFDFQLQRQIDWALVPKGSKWVKVKRILYFKSKTILQTWR